jgi:uncharacterized protein
MEKGGAAAFFISGVMDHEYLILFAIFTFSYATYVIAGFGSTVLILSSAGLFLPVPELLPSVIMLNVLLCAVQVVSLRRDFDPALVRSLLLPGFTLMFMAGFGVYAYLAERPQFLKLLLAALVVAISLHSLYHALRQGERKLPSRLWLALSGLVHGLFVCGGPFLIYYASRLNLTKGKFRTNLLAIWLIMDAILLGAYAAFGQVHLVHLTQAIRLLPTLAIGIVIGEWVHKRISNRGFLLFIYALLLVLGVLLLATNPMAGRLVHQLVPGLHP